MKKLLRIFVAMVATVALALPAAAAVSGMRAPDIRLTNYGHEVLLQSAENRRILAAVEPAGNSGRHARGSNSYGQQLAAQTHRSDRLELADFA